MTDVTNPDYYKVQLTLECNDFTKRMSFNQGNAFKYIWRAGLKGDELTDLRKALWYCSAGDNSMREMISYDMLGLLEGKLPEWKVCILKDIARNFMLASIVAGGVQKRIEEIENKPA